MDFENKSPGWEATGVEPPASLKSTGFKGGDKPPASLFNWFLSLISKCIDELQSKLSTHAADAENPHGVTAAQIGLDQVDNTSDAEKAVKFASEAGEARKVQHNMIVRINGGGTEGTNMWTYDGSTSRSVNITPDKIGAAKADLSNVESSVIREVITSAGGGGIPIISAASEDGILYTATAEEVTELYNGLLITIIPEVVSASANIKLNLNGLGEKMVRLPLSFNNAAMASPKLDTYFTQGRPITLQYDAGYLAGDGIWKVFGKQKTSAQDLYGTVPIEGGGTDATTAEEAREKLGITPDNIGAAVKSQSESLTVEAASWTGEAAPYTATVASTLATAGNHLIVGVGGTVTAEQQEAMAKAMIICTGQADGSITLSAFGDKPEIALPINIICVG